MSTKRKRNTFFIDLVGELGDYTPTLFRTNKTNDPEVMNLQLKLNVIFKEYKDKAATAKNCEEYWKKLTGTCNESYRIVKDNTDPAFLELLNIVQQLGNEIAYLSKRTGYTGGGKQLYQNEEYTDNDFLTIAKYNIINNFTLGIPMPDDVAYTTDEELIEQTKKKYYDTIDSIEKSDWSKVEREAYKRIENDKVREGLIRYTWKDYDSIMTGDNEKLQEQLVEVLKTDSDMRYMWESMYGFTFTEDGFYALVEVAKKRKLSHIESFIDFRNLWKNVEVMRKYVNVK